MKSLLTYIFILIGLPTFAQVFVNGTDFKITENTIVAVKGTDFINDGDVKHSGYLLVDHNITNTKSWICDSKKDNTIEFGRNWTNDSSYIPGIGQVNMIGNFQEIKGLKSSDFYYLNLLGKPLSIKSLSSDITVEKQLNLKNAELACNNSEATMTLNSIEILRNEGFVSTKINGRLNRNFGNQKILFSIFPLGANEGGKIHYMPIVVTESDSGQFRTAFLHQDASNYNMNTTTLDDSLCTVNEEFFHIAGSDPSAKASFGIITDEEYNWSTLATWEGPWTKMDDAKYQSFGQEEAFGVKKKTIGNDKAIVLATEKPFVNIIEEVYVPNEDTYQFDPEYFKPKNSTLTWSPPDHLSCDDCPDPIYTAGLPETYVIEIDNNAGCVVSDTIRIIVIRGDDNPTLIPNAFSPNNDGLNDLFLPHLYSFEELINMSIYNRWGEKIYEGIEGWDGTYRGKPVPLGSYMYKLEIKEQIKNGYYKNNHLAGVLTIIR